MRSGPVTFSTKENHLLCKLFFLTQVRYYSSEQWHWKFTGPISVPSSFFLNICLLPYFLYSSIPPCCSCLSAQFHDVFCLLYFNLKGFKTKNKLRKLRQNPFLSPEKKMNDMVESKSL